MSGTIAPLLDPRDSDWRYANTGEVARLLRPQEPVYLYCAPDLEACASSFQRGFPGTVSYAVKANHEARVIDTLVGQGIAHFDVASLGEVEAVATRHPQAILHFNNPVKVFESIEHSYQRFGVRSFALDDQAELEKILSATRGDPDILCSVRFKLRHEGASYDFGSKFGATPEHAARLLRRVAQAGARPALTFHPGSQCTDPRMYSRYLQAAARIVDWAGVDVEQVNVGGGFPERYRGACAPALERYFKVIGGAMDRYFVRRPRLMCEPGRAMVASSVSLLARVIHVRDNGRSLFLNDGVYGGMQEQSLVDIGLPVRVWRDGRQVRGNTTSWQVFGPTCDPVDRLSREVDLPICMQADDYIEFGLLGAYGSVTATDFNGFRPARYLDVNHGFPEGAGS